MYGYKEWRKELLKCSSKLGDESDNALFFFFFENTEILTITAQ